MKEKIKKIEKLMQEVPAVTPVLMVSNVDKMTDFYQKAFNLELGFNTPNLTGRNVSAFLLFNESRIILREEGQFGLKEQAPSKTGIVCPISLILQYNNLDEQSDAAKQAGAEIIFPPQVMPWGGRLCKVKDPEGYIWFLESINREFSLEKPPVVPSSD